MSTLGSIVVVDDDPEIREIVATYLGEEGYRVSTARDGDEMRRVLDGAAADLVILDLRLPGADGLTLAQELRQSTDLGILILSGKDDVVDRVAGLEVGADDYLTKPFHLRELLARTRSVLRRRSADRLAAPEDEAEAGVARLRFAGWEVDLDSRGIRCADGRDVALTGGEFDLLVAFLEHPNRVLNRDQLLDYARSREAAFMDRSIDVQVGRLRRKIESDPKRPALIKTVRGAGYMLSAKVERL